MRKSRTRPVDLGVFHSRLPVGAWVSILHRISGIMLVLIFPFAYYAFQRSLEPRGFHEMLAVLRTTPFRLVLLVTVAIFAQHFFAGIRHLMLDIDVGIERRQGRIGALAVFVATGFTVAVAIVAWL